VPINFCQTQLRFEDFTIILPEKNMNKGFGRCAAALLSLALLTMAVPQKASAYVDPGAGALLWQVAASGVIGSLFYFRRIAVWIRNRF
jgi:hypothetical protein